MNCSAKATDEYELARKKVAAFINASDSREIVFTRNATEAVNLVAYSWGLSNLKPQDEVCFVFGIFLIYKYIYVCMYVCIHIYLSANEFDSSKFHVIFSRFASRMNIEKRLQEKQIFLHFQWFLRIGERLQEKTPIQSRQ